MNVFFDAIFKSKLKLFAALTLPAFILYFKSIGFDFSPLDEQWMILKNVPFLEKWSSVKDAFTKPMAEIYYRPLFMISLITDYHFSKLVPSFYHFSNLMWHLACVLLLYKFLLQYQATQTKAFILSFLFSIHPIILHAVAWVPGRNDIMLCCFILLTLIYLKKYTVSLKINDLLLHFLYFICALLTKETAIVLPFIFLLIYFINDLLKKRLLALLITVCITITWLFIKNSVTNYYPPVTENFGGTFIQFILAVILFTGKAILPIQQSLYPTIHNANIYVPAIIIILFCVYIYKTGIENKKTAYLGLCMFILLLLVPAWFGAGKSNGEHYEHRLYACLPGFFLFLTQIKLPQNNKTFNYFLVVLICFFVFRSFVRLNIYKDKSTFAEAGVKESPDNYLFQQVKGEMLYKKKKYNEALTFFDKAVTLRPDKGDLYSNRGSANFALGNYTAAINDYTEALNKSGFRKEYVLNRCIAYNKINNYENAKNDYLILKKCCAEIIPAQLEAKFNGK